MKSVLILVLLGVLSGSGTVIAAEDSGGAIEVKLSDVEHGLFNVNITEKLGSRLPVYETTDYLHTTTDTMPIERNLAFGSRFRIDADRGRMLQLLTVWSVPTMDVPGQKEPVTLKSSLARIENHTTQKITYRLDHKWEMQPGEWTLQVFLVGVDKKYVRKVENLAKSPYFIELYKKTFTLEDPDTQNR